MITLTPTDAKVHRGRLTDEDGFTHHPLTILGPFLTHPIFLLSHSLLHFRFGLLFVDFASCSSPRSLFFFLCPPPCLLIFIDGVAGVGPHGSHTLGLECRPDGVAHLARNLLPRPAGLAWPGLGRGGGGGLGVGQPASRVVVLWQVARRAAGVDAWMAGGRIVCLVMFLSDSMASFLYACLSVCAYDSARCLSVWLAVWLVFLLIVWLSGWTIGCLSYFLKERMVWLIG